MSSDEWGDPDSLDEDEDTEVEYLAGTLALWLALGFTAALLVWKPDALEYWALGIAWVFAGAGIRIAEVWLS